MDKKNTIKRDIVRALKMVFDPEIPVNIYDLGLIYEIEVDDAFKVSLKMTLTAPNCPMADDLIDQVNDAVRMTPGVTDLSIDIVFDPPWDKSRISEEGLLELGLL